SRIGCTSFTLSFELSRATDGAALVSSETVYVHVDPKTYRKRGIEPGMRAALERGASGKSVDHAGYQLAQRFARRRARAKLSRHRGSAPTCPAFQGDGEM